MYRIVIDLSTGNWVIQLLCYGLFWNTVKTPHLEGKAQPLQFQTYDDARSYVTRKGLDEVYHNHAHADRMQPQ